MVRKKSSISHVDAHFWQMVQQQKKPNIIEKVGREKG